MEIETGRSDSIEQSKAVGLCIRHACACSPVAHPVPIKGCWGYHLNTEEDVVMGGEEHSSGVDTTREREKEKERARDVSEV